MPSVTSDGRPLSGKKVIGSWKDGAIHIWPDERDGNRGRPGPRVKDSQQITLAEGIETS
jgi:hypothetical protein